MFAIENHKKLFNIIEHNMIDEETIVIPVKFRGINPFVLTNEGLTELTQINPEFKEKYYSLKEKIQKGWPVKFAFPSNCQTLHGC